MGKAGFLPFAAYTITHPRREQTRPNCFNHTAVMTTVPIFGEISTGFVGVGESTGGQYGALFCAILQ
jgi:hypothetical protein